MSESYDKKWAEIVKVAMGSKHPGWSGWTTRDVLVYAEGKLLMESTDSRPGDYVWLALEPGQKPGTAPGIPLFRLPMRTGTPISVIVFASHHIFRADYVVAAKGMAPGGETCEVTQVS